MVPKPKPEGVPKNLNHDGMKAVLEAHGWVATIGGKHSTKMEKAGERPITIPRHHNETYGASLRSRMLRQAGLQGGGQAADEHVDDASGE